MNDDHQSAQVLDFYAGFVHDSVLWNNYRSLQAIFSVQCYLKNLNIPSVQTYMDYEMFDQTWHAPDYIKELQELVRPELQLFEGKNFVDWSHLRGFPVTIEGNHPLEEAHKGAADYWENMYRCLL